jgi:hypothetical protein
VIELGVDPNPSPEDLVKLPELARLLGKSVDELLPAFEIPSEPTVRPAPPRALAQACRRRGGPVYQHPFPEDQGRLRQPRV